MRKIIDHFCILLWIYLTSCQADLYEGDSCSIGGKSGICVEQDDCWILKSAFYEGKISNYDIPRCGYTITKEIVCCPLGESRQNEEIPNENRLRPAIEYCNQIEDDAQIKFRSHDYPSNEYPHMAAIGYTNLNDNSREFPCDGSLIAKKFVLTAANCVTDRTMQPDVVMLGATSLTETSDVVIKNILTTYPHPEYKPGLRYDDIALIEFHTEVEYSSNIYPICLHYDYGNPSPNADLCVAGWGVTEIQKHSQTLSATKVNLISLESCNNQTIALRSSFLPQGIIDKQICTQNKEPKDGCFGDSGGPLMMVQDKTRLQYRVVGITISSTDSNGYTSFYTRVSYYLDFIEDIVWSKNGL